MNMLLCSISNKINKSTRSCIYCGKSYIKKDCFEKHMLICELKHNSRKNFEEDEIIVPSQKIMFKMLLELGQKYNRIEEKIEEINKWVVKKKKKINMIEWLNTNITPIIVFDKLFDKISITEEDIKFLLQNSVHDTFNEIFSRTIYNVSETENPIFAFIQKVNVFYIYDLIDGIGTWIELPREGLIKFLNKVHKKVVKVFYDWKLKHSNEVKQSDTFALMCDKTLVKLMSVDFKVEGTLNKIRNLMYSHMKTDMKALVEYEFEF